jgi:hypothetical protein
MLLKIKLDSDILYSYYLTRTQIYDLKGKKICRNH